MNKQVMCGHSVVIILQGTLCCWLLTSRHKIVAAEPRFLQLYLRGVCESPGGLCISLVSSGQVPENCMRIGAVTLYWMHVEVSDAQK